MNKTKIEWCDSTWNPVTGCYHGCPYCYARNMINRFSGKAYIIAPADGVKEINEPVKDENGKRIPYPFAFTPTLHRYRLNDYKDKSGRTIFVCSMADLFGDWVPDSWIEEVFTACKQALQHNYLFLTKNPKRYAELALKQKLPNGDAFWYGTTVTTPDEDFFFSIEHHTFLSIEPIMGDFSEDFGHMCKRFSEWIVTGAETGNRKDKIVPKRKWVAGLADVCKREEIPLFMKDSLIPIIGEENMIREFPWEEWG